MMVRVEDSVKVQRLTCERRLVRTGAQGRGGRRQTQKVVLVRPTSVSAVPSNRLHAPGRNRRPKARVAAPEGQLSCTAPGPGTGAEGGWTDRG